MIQSGDTIRLLEQDGSIRGDFTVRVEDEYVVRLADGNPATAILRDLPRWDDALKVWLY